MYLKVGCSVALVKRVYLCMRMFLGSAHNSGDELKVGAQRHAANWGYLAHCVFMRSAEFTYSIRDQLRPGHDIIANVIHIDIILRHHTVAHRHARAHHAFGFARHQRMPVRQVFAF